jgi:hypothetical protein
LPTAAATRCKRTATKKDVATVVGTAGAVTSPSPPAPATKRKQRRPQQKEPPGDQGEVRGPAVHYSAARQRRQHLGTLGFGIAVNLVAPVLRITTTQGPSNYQKQMLPL